MTLPQSAIVTVGAGASSLVDDLLEAGRSVIAVDLSAAALSILEDRIGPCDRLRLLRADARSVVLDCPVDAWHDRALFHFLTDPTDQRSYATAAAATLKPGGHLVIATFGPNGPSQCSGLPVQRHDAESLAAVFGPSFELRQSFEVDHLTPWGSTQQFTQAVFSRSWLSESCPSARSGPSSPTL